MFKRHKAFTFAELLVAIGILSGSLGIMIYSYLSFLNVSRYSRSISLASQIAAAKIEDIKSDGFDDIAAYNNMIFSATNITAFPQDITLPQMDYRGIVYVDDFGGNTSIKQITVIVCWRQGNRTIGEDWVFDTTPDPTLHARPSSPVSVTTILVEH